MHRIRLSHFRDYRIILLAGLSVIIAFSAIIFLFLIANLALSVSSPVTYETLATARTEAYTAGDIAQSYLLSKYIINNFSQDVTLEDLTILLDSAAWLSHDLDIHVILTKHPEWQSAELMTVYNCYQGVATADFDFDCTKNLTDWSAQDLLLMADKTHDLSLNALSLVYSRELVFQVPNFYQAYTYQAAALAAIGQDAESERLIALSNALTE